MVKARSQAFRQMRINTPLGNDVLLLRGVRFSESLGRLPMLELDLLSEEPGLAFEDIIGKNITVEIELIDDAGVRHLNGYVSRFTQTGRIGRTCQYHATVVPWLWMLTRTADCRIFQEATVPEIIKKVFEDHADAAFEDRLSSSYQPWEYCVQYGESDFDFVSRLMEQEGIYYFFTHDDGKHCMVLTDGPAGHESCPGHEEIPFRAGENAFAENEHISEWMIDKQIQAGNFVQNDFDFKAPRKPLETRSSIQRSHSLGSHEIYEYPGEYVEYGDGDRYAKIRMQEMQSAHEVIRGQTDVRALQAGQTFTLTEHPRPDQEREYLVISADFEAAVDDIDSTLNGSDDVEVTFRSYIESIPATEVFRPARLTQRPFIRGPQTAIIVGPDSEEIWTDEYGRVKVQFHWDRRGQRNEDSSCWIRVSQVWAGPEWGAMFIPRIGQEVIVEFLEGDPDRPIITGRVYNGDNMPPYALPENKTQSGIKSRSSKDASPNNFNEIRLEDKKGSELFYVQAEKDRTALVKNNNSETVQANETISVGDNRNKSVGKDETTEVGDNRTETVGMNETITVGVDRTEQVGSNETITIGANRTLNVAANNSEAVGADKSVVVAANDTLAVGANRTVTVGANQSSIVGANQTVAVGANETRTVGSQLTSTVGMVDTSDAGLLKMINAGLMISINAGVMLKLVGPGGSITLGPSGIHIKGSEVKIEGDTVLINP